MKTLNDYIRESLLDDEDKLIASIKKEWLSLGDCYEFDIQDTKNVELVLAVILMIDEVIDQANND